MYFDRLAAYVDFAGSLEINYLFLILVCLLLTVIARLSRAVDSVCAYVLGILFAYVVSINESNFDHQNYVNHITEIVSMQSSGIAAQFAIAKDPIFLVFVNLGRLVSSDYITATIAFISAAAIYLKVMATELLPRRRTLFLTMYVVFLAPQFEFEALRAGLALSFVLFSLSRSRLRTRIFAWILAVFSHASALIVGVGLLHRRISSWKSLVFTLLAALGLLGAVFLVVSRTEQYLSNSGTVNAFVPPIITAVSICLGRASLDHSYDEKLGILNFIYWSSLISTICAICVAPYMVTVSFRILAIAWVTYLFFFFLYKKGGSSRPRIFLMRSVSMVMLIIVMSYASVKNEAWTILLSGWR